MKTRPIQLVLASAALAATSGILLAQGMGAGPRGAMMGGMGGMGGRMGGMSGVQAPSDNPITPAKVALGKQLYFDSRLSKGMIF